MFARSLPASIRSAARSQVGRQSRVASPEAAAIRISTIIPGRRPYSDTSSSESSTSGAGAKADASKSGGSSGSDKRGSSSSASSGDAAATAAAAAADKVKALEAQIKELKDRDLYNRAEIQTLSRRISEERTKASEFAISKFALALVGTSDVLTTALSHVPQPVTPGSALATLYDGVSLTQKSMWKTFEQNGVKKMVVDKGGEFDPNLHEATFSIPPSAAGPAPGGKEWGGGQVVEVAKEGWMIGSRVLRPAQVGITQIE